MFRAASDTFLIEPSPVLMISTVFAVAVAIAGVVVALKGRWGWFLLGLLLAGLPWLLGAFQTAADGSLWARMRSRGRNAQDAATRA